MIITIVALISFLAIGAVIFHGIQQHRERQEAEKRAEIAKQKALLDETETVLTAMSALPFNNSLSQILQKRVHSSLVLLKELNPTMPDVGQRIKDVEEVLNKPLAAEEPKTEDALQIPTHDKQIIQYIQIIKRLRIILRSEHSKGRVDSASYSKEDKLLERFQLKVNVETLARRANNAIQSNMTGSARQYYEKALGALKAQTAPSDYIKRRTQELSDELLGIQEKLRTANAEDTKKRQEEERDDLDELFAPKKKW